MFDVIAGLPAHPLVVHLPVVLLPLASVGLILLAAIRSWRPRFAMPVLAILAAGTAGAVLAMVSGNAFAYHVGRPNAHAAAGTNLVIGAVALLLVGGAWLIWARSGESTRAKDVLGWVVAVVAAVVVALTVIVGHSGASAAWSGAIAVTPSASAEPTPSAKASTTQSTETASPAGTSPEATGGSSGPTETFAEPTETTSSASGYTLADVEAHNTQDSCWAAIEGNVFDLTDWISQHPGGASHIVALCGTDGTSAFEGQHSGDSRPADELASFLLGPLVG